MLTDTSPMPWGKHQGQQMQNVPASYLIWLYENDKCSADVKAYIFNNLETLRLEVKQKIKK